MVLLDLENWRGVCLETGEGSGATCYSMSASPAVKTFVDSRAVGSSTKWQDATKFQAGQAIKATPCLRVARGEL